MQFMSIITFLYAHWVLSSLFVLFLLAFVLFELRTRMVGPKRLSPQEAVGLMNKERPLILDLREKSKFDQGHIIDAQSCTDSNLEETLKKLKVSSERPILLVCQLGHTTVAAGARLKKLGFTHVYQVAGGMTAWISAELPLQK